MTYLHRYSPCDECSIHCDHCKYHPAYRCYGSNYPDNFQGGILPGDEAYCECTLTGEECNTDDPDICPLYNSE